MPGRPITRSSPRYLASEARRISRKLYRRFTRHDQRLARLRPAGSPRGRVLLSYVLDPLLLPLDHDLPHSHTHFWETREIARSFLDLGWAVDGISWTHRTFEPNEGYEVIIDPRANLERLAETLPTAQAIFHSDTCHWAASNAAQEARQQALTQRRGVRLDRHKLVEENRGAEAASIVCYLGNDFTRRTFENALRSGGSGGSGGEKDFTPTDKPLVRIPVSVPFEYDWPGDRDWEQARRRFLWFGSGGLVHKGLDLVLEAFAGMPELELTVCGPVERERDFERLYWRELYETANINTLGWIDSRPEHFAPLAARHGALIYPSCAEGGGSSALTCMHAGLAPLLTPAASVDLEPDRGVLLTDVTVEGLRAAAQSFAEMPPGESEQMARTAWEWVRQHHTRSLFACNYRRFAGRVTGERSSGDGE